MKTGRDILGNEKSQVQMHEERMLCGKHQVVSVNGGIENKAGQIGRDQVIKGLVCQSKEFALCIITR